MKKEQKITFVLLVIYLIILTWIILLKTQFSFSALGHYRSVNLIPFAGSVVINGKVDLDEILNNFIVFIPVGLYLGMMMPKSSPLRKIAPIFGLSLLYEVIQFIYAIGASDITDMSQSEYGFTAIPQRYHKMWDTTHPRICCPVFSYSHLPPARRC